MPSRSATIPEPVRTSPVKNWKLLLAGWLPVVIGVMWWVADGLRGGNSFVVLSLFGYYAALAISVVVHEFCHFVAAQRLGLKPWRLRIGHGDVVFEQQYSTFKLELRMFPYSGAVYPFYIEEERWRTKWREFAMVLAGPLGNAVLLGLFGLIAIHTVEAGNVTSFPAQVALMNVYLVASALIPRYGRMDGLKMPNDGLILVGLLLGRRFKSLRSIGGENATQTRTSGPSWHWIVRQMPGDDLLDRMKEQLDDPAVSSEQRARLLDAFATCVLMYGAESHLADADRYSEELLRAKD